MGTTPEASRENLIRNKNPLLEGPEFISIDLEDEFYSDGESTFTSDTRIYHLGHHEDRPYIVIEFFDNLPDELDEEEKAKFTEQKRDIDGRERRVFSYKIGAVLDKKVENRAESGLEFSKEYHIASPRNIILYNFKEFAQDDANQSVLVEILLELEGISIEEAEELSKRLLSSNLKDDQATMKTVMSQVPNKNKREIWQSVKERFSAHPKEVNVEQLSELLSNKKILFYTGAGISIEGGVHGMDQLMQTLQIDTSKEVDGLLVQSLKNPEDVLQKWHNIIKTRKDSQPTKTHQALARIAQKFGSKIFTENMDILQEKTGVAPNHISGPWLRENIRKEWLKDIDIIVTIGLSYDDRGFLAWFKNYNPHGKIVAFDFAQPIYLGDEDYLVKGDLQKLLPGLEDYIK